MCQGLLDRETGPAVANLLRVRAAVDENDCRILDSGTEVGGADQAGVENGLVVCADLHDLRGSNVVFLERPAVGFDESGPMGAVGFEERPGGRGGKVGVSV